MSYYAHDDDKFQEIKQYLDELGEYLTRMNSWEHNFSIDLRNRLAKYGREVSLSDRQFEVLCNIHTKYVDGGEPRQKDTTDGFRELENRDKWRRF